jgi:isoleucyl-tRNA synthetase
LSGYLKGGNVLSSDFGTATAVHKQTIVSESKQLASQHHNTVSGFQNNFGSPSVETYSPNNNCSSLNHLMEMERYLVECIEHHQRLIGCIICECTEYNCFTVIGLFLNFTLSFTDFPRS